jgi:hypothetical protein
MMVDKCANPECSNPFYYGLGRLYFSPKRLADKSPSANSHGVEHFWLCESCSKSYTFGLHGGPDAEITPPLHSSRFEDKLNCKNCKSEDVRIFKGELTASSLRIKHVKNEPIYVCRAVLVCVECGLTELIIPSRELERFRRISAIGS